MNLILGYSHEVTTTTTKYVIVNKIFVILEFHSLGGCHFQKQSTRNMKMLKYCNTQATFMSNKVQYLRLEILL